MRGEEPGHRLPDRGPAGDRVGVREAEFRVGREVGDELVGVERVDVREYLGYVPAHGALPHWRPAGQDRRSGTARAPRSVCSLGNRMQPGAKGNGSSKLVCSLPGLGRGARAQASGSALARKAAGGGAPHRCGGTSQSPATQQSSIWSISENHSIQEPHGIRVVVEEVRADGVAAQAPAGLPAPAAHPVGADRDRVDGRHLEAGVVEAAVGAGDEPEDVVVARPGVEERDQARDPVADPQAQHLGVELGHLLGLRGEQQGVPEPAGQHVLGGPRPLGHADPLPAAAHVEQHLVGGPGRGRGLVEQLHRRCRPGRGSTAHPRSRRAGARSPACPPGPGPRGPSRACPGSA